MRKNLQQLINYSAGGILSKVILKNTTQEITLFCMAKGTEISDHTSTKQGFLYVIEGDGIFTLEGEEIQMSAGVFIFMEENKVHSIEAKENTSFVLVLSEK
jgi:nitric oxide dioxygenase